jgi:hypothetical protein
MIRRIFLTTIVLGAALAATIFFAPSGNAIQCGDPSNWQCQSYPNSRVAFLSGYVVCAFSGSGCEECIDFEEGCVIVCEPSCQL